MARVADGENGEKSSGADGKRVEAGGGREGGADDALDDGLGAGWRFWRRRRYVVATLAFLGFFNVYALRVNLSVAIVAMTSNRTVPLANGTSHTELAEFPWTVETQNFLLSAFFFGYIATQLLGGWLAARVGGARLFGAGIAATALLTLLTPPIARAGYGPLLAVRIIEGLFEGVTYPCIHAVWARWAPPLERSRLATLAFSGSYVGTVVAMPVCGVLGQYVGWPSIFYVFGAVGVAWFAVWVWLVREGPELDTRIAPSELRFLQTALGDCSSSAHAAPRPWAAFLTSMPVWSIVAAHFCENWGFYTLLTQLPSYMKKALHFRLEKTGFLSALPYLVMAVILQFAGHIADALIRRQWLSVTNVRKLFNCGAFVSQTVFMLLAARFASPAAVVACLTAAVGLGAFAWSGFSVNHLDIAPQHASVLMGISNTFATLPGMVSPILTSFLVGEDDTDPDKWSAVFYIASAIYLAGAVFYAVFASGERQSWALTTTEKPPARPPGSHAYANQAMEMEAV